MTPYLICIAHFGSAALLWFCFDWSEAMTPLAYLIVGLNVVLMYLNPEK